MAGFFIDIDTGQVATHRQLAEAGLASLELPPTRPWHPVRGAEGASTLWYAIMRKQTRGVFIGTMCIRHSPHHASLLKAGWQEVAVEDIQAFGADVD
jgi:hypothetical protein